MELDDHDKDIPIWFNGTQRWMAGLTRRTTCDDVIYAILYSSGLHEAEATDNYAIFEKWREVERPLSSRTKILKVWAFWGEEQPNVSLSMRSLNDYFLPGESSLYMRSRRRHKKQSRQRSSRHSPTCKCHDRRSCGECCRLKSLEHLVKLVVNQERKLQDITDHIVDTDRLIEKHEGRIHEHRVQQNGLDYVQDSYLNSHSSGSGSSSSVDSATLSVATLDLNEARGVFAQSSLAELGEITRMCDQLNHLERCLAVEKAKEQELELEVGKIRQGRGQEEREGEEANTGLEEARVELLRAVTSHVTQEYNERMIDRRMESCLAEVQDRTAFLQALHNQLAEVESRMASNTGGEPVRSDSVSLTHPLDGLSSDSDGDVFVQTQPPEHSHEPSHQASPSLHCFDKMVPHNSRPNQQGHMSLGHIGMSRTQDSPAGTDKNLSSQTPSKSMTGRGRFARDPIRRGVGSTAHSTTNSKEHFHSTHFDISKNGEKENNEKYSGSVFPQPSATGQSYLPSPLSSKLPNPGISLNATSERDNIDPVNIGRTEEMGSADGKVSKRLGQSSENPNSQRLTPKTESGFDRTGHSVVSGSPGSGQCTNSSKRFPGGARLVRNSAVNSVGSCGDISNLGTSSPSAGIGVSGQSKSGFGGRERQRAGQTLAPRRSRSADRDRSHSQGHRGKVNARGQKQSVQQYYDSGHNSEEERVNNIEVVSSYGLDTSLVGNDSWNQPNFHDRNKQRFELEPNNTDFSQSAAFRRGAPVSFQNKVPSISKDNTVSSHTTNNSDKSPSNPHQNSAIYDSNKDNWKQHSNGGHSYFSVFEQNKPAPGQNVQSISNKALNRSTGFIFRMANKGKLDKPANSNTVVGGNEKSPLQNGYSLKTLHDLRNGLRDTQGSGQRNDALFAQGIAGNSQDKQQPNSSPLSGNNYGAQPQTRTGLSSQDNARSIPPGKSSEFNISQNKHRLREPVRTTNSINFANGSQPSPVTNVETNPSRGALYHIVSQKLNASKEKIRLNSMQDAGKDQTDKNGSTSRNETQSSSRQFYNQEPKTKEIATSGEMARGSWYQKQQKSMPPTTPVFSSTSVTNTTDHSTGQSSDRVPPPKSSHNVSSPTVADPKALNNDISKYPQQRELSAHSFKDAGNSSFPKQSYNHHQQYQHHQQQHHQNNQTRYQGQQQKSFLPHNPNQQHSVHQQQQQQQQSQYHHYHHQNGPVPNGYNRSQDQVLSHHHEETNPQLTASEEIPYRRSALNPHFYDMNKTEEKFRSEQTAANPQHNKRAIVNGSVGVVEFQHNDSTRIMSYLQQTNSGFLKNLKSSALPQSLSASRSTNSNMMTSNGRVTAPPTLTSQKPDHFDLNEPRKMKAKMEDSNDSDTGLSSMHSDETANMETLV